MARYWFGQSLTDWSMAFGDETEDGGVTYAPVSAAGPVEVTFWNAESGGTRYTDLLDASGTPVDAVTTADGTGSLPVGTLPRFQGPDPQGSPLTTLPAQFRPTGGTRWSIATITPDNFVRLRIGTNGVLYADNPAKRVTVGRALRFNFVYLR